MNYEEKYKESLEKARKIWYETEFDYEKGMMEEIFPELKESDDERIRKEIISIVKSYRKSCITEGNHRFDDCIEWLEKQGEQKPIEEYDVPDTPIKDSEVVTSRMKYIDENLKPIAEFVMDYANWDLRKDEWNHPVPTVPLFRVLDALIQKGKQYSEEYSVVDNNTEPKFKAGDWITNGEYTWKVTDIKPLDYILQSQNGDEIDDTIYYVDEHFHLWTIQDAKDGDVLYFDDDTIVMFKNLYNNSTFHSHCHIEYGLFGINSDDLPDWWESEGFHPSTKEQRDILFQKIKEAGYEWDAEKKQLIKK